MLTLLGDALLDHLHVAEVLANDSDADAQRRGDLPLGGSRGTQPSDLHPTPSAGTVEHHGFQPFFFPGNAFFRMSLTAASL